MNIYIVEDSAVIRDRIVKALSSIPAVEIVGEATDSTSAILDISKLKPDVVILDMKLEAGSGLDVLASVNTDKSDTKIIVFTNYSFYRNACMEAGADYFFDKSMEISEMLKTVVKFAEEYSNDDTRFE